MPFNKPEAEQHIRDAIARKVPRETCLIPVDSPSVAIYGYDPEGWLLYVILRRDDCRLGGDEYVAYHQKTHEVRFLGIHGD
jgi:hypothetical protein